MEPPLSHRGTALLSFAQYVPPDLTNVSDVPGNSCDGFIVKIDPALHALVYGTLIGGNKYDMLLDVGHDDDNVYITGESRSTGGFATDLNPLRYFQAMNSNITTRDAVVLAIRSREAVPELVWRTAFGGVKSERGWGIAGSSAKASDVYIVGAAASTLPQAFPLKEFSTTSTLDYYQDINMYGTGGDGPLTAWYSFERALNFENGVLGFASPEATHQGHDGYIASFAAYHPVGIADMSAAGNDNVLQVFPLPGDAQWSLRLPHSGHWTLEVYDALGQELRRSQTIGTSLVLDLATEATGLYVLRAFNTAGECRSAKVLRP